MLTTSGRTAAALSVVLLVAGLATRYTELIAIAVALLTVLGAAALWMTSRPRLDAQRTVSPNRVTQSQSASAELTVVNLARRRSPSMLSLEQFGATWVQVAIPGLEAGDAHTKSYRLPTERRGVFQVGPLIVSRSDPFGLMRVGQRQHSSEQLWVHPIVHKLTPFPSGRARDLEGPTSGEAPEGGIAFHTLRDYVVGDDLRLVHWRSSARTGSLMVRHNVDTNQPRTLVVLDTRADVYTESSFEDVIRCAASITMASTSNNFPIRLRTTCGKTISSERGGRAEQILDLLASLEPDRDARLANVVPSMASEPGGFSLAVLTGQSSPADLAAVGPMRARFETITIGRLGAEGSGGMHQLPGAVLINAASSEDFAVAWNRRVNR